MKENTTNIASESNTIGIASDAVAPGSILSDSEFLAHYDASEFEHPSVTVDVLIFTVDINDGLELLLICRDIPPYQNCWAIPGGFIQMDESLEEAARRKLAQETGVTGVPIEQLYTFGDVHRDPRTRVISVAYFALIPKTSIQIQIGEGVSNVGWFPVHLREQTVTGNQLENTMSGNGIEERLTVGDGIQMAFDHSRIIATAIDRLRGKLSYTDIAFHLLKDQNRFAIYELQKIYEAILEQKLNTPNFRRMFLNTYVAKKQAEPIGEECHEYSKRASQYYRKV